MQKQEETKVTEPKETKSHRAKRYLRVIIIFIVLFAGGSILGGFLSDALAFDEKQQKLLKEEIAKIAPYTNTSSYDYDQLNIILEDTVTTKQYVPIEKAIKAFTKDVVTVTGAIEADMKAEVMQTALSSNNIAADGPSFTVTLEELDKIYSSLDAKKTEFQTLMTDEKVLSYLPEDTEEELIGVYKEIVSAIKMTETDKRYIGMIENIDKVLAMIDAEKAAINYLVENQKEWKLEGGHVLFNTEEQVAEYNTLLEAFQKVAK